MAKKGLSGSIEKRGEDRYRITIYTGRKLPNGEYERYRETFHGSEEDAEQRRIDLLSEMGYRPLDASKVILYRDHLKQWLRRMKGRTEASTYDGYKQIAETRLIPELGSIPIRKLSPVHIDEFYSSLLEDGARLDGKPGPLSARTLHHIHTVLKSSLKLAVKWRRITHNPALDVELPKAKRPEKRLWNERRLKKFLDAIKGDENEALLLTFLWTGARSNEVFVLKWADIEFEDRRIRIDENLKKNRTIGDTKSHQTRYVPMSDDLYRALKEHKSKQNATVLESGGTWNPKGYVFPSQAGTPLHLSNFHRRLWVPLINRINKEEEKKAEKEGREPDLIPYINPHGTRHTFLTQLLRSVDDPKIAADIAGHYSVAFTLDQYDHPDEDDHRKAMSDFSRRLKRDSG